MRTLDVIGLFADAPATGPSTCLAPGERVAESSASSHALPSLAAADPQRSSRHQPPDLAADAQGAIEVWMLTHHLFDRDVHAAEQAAPEEAGEQVAPRPAVHITAPAVNVQCVPPVVAQRAYRARWAGPEQKLGAVQCCRAGRNVWGQDKCGVSCDSACVPRPMGWT